LKQTENINSDILLSLAVLIEELADDQKDQWTTAFVEVRASVSIDRLRSYHLLLNRELA